jgi:hypothetical protein
LIETIDEYGLKREDRKRAHAKCMFIEDPPKKLRALNDIRINAKAHTRKGIEEQSRRKFDRIIDEYDLKGGNRKRAHANYMFIEDPPKKLRALNNIRGSAKTTHTHSSTCLSKNGIAAIEL